MKALNLSFLPVLDYLVCYKSEIGLAAQKLIECYNIIILD